MISRDDALVDLLIPILNEVEGASFALSDRPDERVCNQPSIEAVAIDQRSGCSLRIEHTRLEPFEGEGADYGRLRDIADVIEADASLVVRGRELDVDFEVGAFAVFEKWTRDKDRVRDEIVTWLRANGSSMPLGYSEHTLSLPEQVTIGVSVEGAETEGTVRVGRRNPPQTFDQMVPRSVARKLPKLVAEAASKYVLLLEKYIPLRSRYDIGREVRLLSSEFPDLQRSEVWVADTNGWHSARTVGFYRVWPRVDRKTRWVRDVDEVKLVHKRHLTAT